VNKNVRNGIILGILALVFGYFLFTRVLSESQEERAFRENLEQQQKARESGQAPTTAAGTPTAGPATADNLTAPGSANVIREDEIDLAQLAAGIKEVEFDYDKARKEEQLRNPMAPLVGPDVQARVPGTGVGDEPASADDEAVINAIRRNLMLTGIMWHPTAPVAIINNDIVPPGYKFPNEMFRTARSTTGVLEEPVLVARMTRNSVILKYKDSEITLELKER
jgi:hypothetical protein